MEGNRKRKWRFFMPFYIIGPHLRQHVKHLDKLWYGNSTVSYSDLAEELNFILITPIQIVLCHHRNLISTILHRKKILNLKSWRVAYTRYSTGVTVKFFDAVRSMVRETRKYSIETFVALSTAQVDSH
jgi:hypothetical protein